MSVDRITVHGPNDVCTSLRQSLKAINSTQIKGGVLLWRQRNTCLLTKFAKKKKKKEKENR